MDNLLQHIPQDLYNFLLVALFSMLIGLEQRLHHDSEKPKSLLGTDRTFTFIGILGYILYLFDPVRMLFFGLGGLSITVFLAIFYISKIWKEKQSGLTSIIVALITYSLAPLVYTQPHWLVLLILVTILILVEVKEDLIAFSEKIDKNIKRYQIFSLLNLHCVLLIFNADNWVTFFIFFELYRSHSFDHRFDPNHPII